MGFILVSKGWFRLYIYSETSSSSVPENSRRVDRVRGTYATTTISFISQQQVLLKERCGLFVLAGYPGASRGKPVNTWNWSMELSRNTKDGLELQKV